MKPSKRLQQAVVKSTMSRYRISKITGIPQSTLSRFVNGVSALSGGSFDELAEVLDLELVPRKRRKGR